MDFQRSGGPPAAAESWKPRKTGLNTEDVNHLVRCLRAGLPWHEAKRELADEIDDAALEGWREEVLRRAAPRPTAAPAVPAAGSFTTVVESSPRPAKRKRKA